MIDPVPFRSAAEAWMWFVDGQISRYEGRRPSSWGVMRPCDIDDVARAVLNLIRSHRLSVRHLLVMIEHGLLQSAPDPYASFAQRHARILWDQAMDRLTTPLAARGIVEPRQKKHLTPAVRSEIICFAAGRSAPAP